MLLDVWKSGIKDYDKCKNSSQPAIKMCTAYEPVENIDKIMEIIEADRHVSIQSIARVWSNLILSGIISR